MPTGPWKLHGPAVTAAFSGQLDIDANPNLFVMFTSSAYVPNVDHAFENQLTNIVSGTNLPAAGVSVTGTAAYNATTDVTTIDISDVSVANVTATGIRNAHLVDKTGGTPLTNRLVASVTFDADLSPQAGALNITIDAAGLLTHTAT